VAAGKPPKSPYPPDLDEDAEPVTELEDLDDAVADGLDWANRQARRVFLRRAELRRCRLTGAELAEARLEDVTFDDCRLDLVSKSQRRGKEVGGYFARYQKEDVSLRLVRLEGQLVLAAHVGGAERPSYFILLTCESGDGGQVTAIRDFRYVPYMAAEAEFERV